MEQEVKQEENVDSGPENEQHSDNTAIDVQAKIDSAVKARLAREKEVQKQMQAQWEEERKALEEENMFLKEQFTKKIDEQLADLPPSFRSLVAKLDIRSQIEWFAEQAKENEAKPKAPDMPHFDKKNKEGSKGEIEHLPIDRFA